MRREKKDSGYRPVYNAGKKNQAYLGGGENAPRQNGEGS